MGPFLFPELQCTDQKDRSTGDENGTGDSKVMCETALVFGQITLWDCLVGKFSQFPAQT